LSLSKSISPDASDRWFNIRSGGLQTPVGYKWEKLDDYSPEAGEGDQSPITAWKFGEGDGVVANWSAFHSSTQQKNRISIQTSFPHARLLESAEILLTINSLL
jgi:hypothetical protein